MFLSASWCAEPMTQSYKLKLKVLGFCDRGYDCPSDVCLVILDGHLATLACELLSLRQLLTAVSLDINR